MSKTETLPARYANGRIGPGNPGRPVGSYNRASRRAAMAILDHFEAIQEDFLRRLDSNQYLTLLSRVLPRQFEIVASPGEELAEAEVGATLAAARALIAADGDPRSTLVELTAVVAGEPSRR